jgi:histidine triad (HIT) family protein
MSDCLFCKIIAGDIPSQKVYEDDKMFVFKDIAPKADVHLLAIPKIHIESLNEVNSEHDEVMAHMLRQLPQLAKAQGLNDGFRTIINTGEGGGQIVFHLHMHLLGGRNLPGFQ